MKRCYLGVRVEYVIKTIRDETRLSKSWVEKSQFFLNENEKNKEIRKLQFIASLDNINEGKKWLKRKGGKGNWAN